MARLVRSGVLVVIAAALIGFAWISNGSAAGEAKRVALVIGNGAYQFAPRLPNPANDARDVAQLLRGLDFDVVEAVDVDRAGFVKALGTFMDKASAAPAALLYYGGHGVQVGDDNFLLPVDAKLDSLFSLKNEALSLHQILDDLEAVSKVNLVFLDACRDNPLAEQLSRAIKTRSGASPLGRGLARVAPNSANTFIAFAAAPGAVALDGSGRNSPFAKAFLSNVAASNDDVMIVFKGIIRDVEKATGGQQRPQMVSGMTVDFHFNGDTSVVINAPAAVSEAQAAFDAAARIDTADAYRAVVETFPGTIQAKLAEAAEKKRVAALPEMRPSATLGPPVPAASDTPAIARIYTSADIAADADPRLAKALRALSGYSVIPGTFRDHLYIAVLDKASDWDRAEQLAETAGGHLVTIGDKAENEFVRALFAKDERYMAADRQKKSLLGPFIGLRQKTGAKEPAGGWGWVTGEPITFRNWNDTEPNNYNGNENAAAYVQTARGGGRWNDIPADGGANGFIIEVEPAEVTNNPN